MGMNLAANERVVFEGHPSWRSIIGFYLKGIIGFLVLGFLLNLASVDSGIVALVVVFGVAMTVIVGFVRRWATVYTITTRRLHIKFGIIARKVQETKIERVQDVTYNQSVYQRIMQIGDVDFDTAAQDASGFVFAGVANPEGIVQEVHEATEVGGLPPQTQAEANERFSSGL